MTQTTAKAPREAAEESFLAAMRSYASDPQPRHLAAAAEALVDLRETFFLRDGSPDYRGQSHDYRQAAASLYAATPLTGDALRRAQATVRYHVSEVQRSRYDTETLEALGLKTESALERSRAGRRERAAAARISQGGPITDPGEAVQAILSARSLLSRIETSALEAIAAHARPGARSALQSVARLATARARKLDG